MTIKGRIIERVERATMVFFVLLLSGVYSCTLHAQGLKPIRYIGFEASFGVRSFKVNVVLLR